MVNTLPKDFVKMSIATFFHCANYWRLHFLCTKVSRHFKSEEQNDLRELQGQVQEGIRRHSGGAPSNWSNWNGSWCFQKSLQLNVLQSCNLLDLRDMLTNLETVLHLSFYIGLLLKFNIVVRSLSRKYIILIVFYDFYCGIYAVNFWMTAVQLVSMAWKCVPDCSYSSHSTLLFLSLRTW